MSKIIIDNIDNDKLVDYFLETTTQKGKFPTDPFPIIESLDLNQLEFNFVNEFRNTTEKDLNEMRALLSYDEKVIALNSLQTSNKSRAFFSLFHEIAHYILPEHIEKFYLCSQDDMSEKTIITLEAEANRLAADFIYQGDFFTKEANEMPIDVNSICLLKEKYQSSFESISRRFIERNIFPCALIVYEKKENNKWDVSYTITSPIFRERYFNKIIKDDDNPLVLEIQQSSDIQDSIKDEVIFEIDNLGKKKFFIEYFYNRYKVFSLLKPILK